MADDKYTSRHTGQQIDDAVDAVGNKADVINVASGVYKLPISQLPWLSLYNIEAIATCDSNNKLWFCTDGHLYYRKDGSINADGKDFDMGTPAYVVYYKGTRTYRWTGSAFEQVGGGNVINALNSDSVEDALSAAMGKELAQRIASMGGGSSIERQMIDLIITILKNGVFTSDQSDNFTALDELAEAVESITLNEDNHVFNGISGTFTLVATTIPSGKSVSWESSNSSIASVNNGVVTPHAIGNCTITARAGDKTATCTIQVQNVQVQSVSLNKNSLSLNGNGSNETLIATTIPANCAVSWESSNAAIASVDNNGKVTAVGNGSCTITARAGDKTAQCSVSVSGVVNMLNISVGTLNGVTLTDGNGDAVTDGDTIAENSALTLNFSPASSYVINSLSVVMGSTEYDLTDATDGTNGTKIISIQSVTDDIEVTASASYQRTNLVAGLTPISGKGISTTGSYETNSAYSSFMVPVEFGKRYQVEGYFTTSNSTHNCALMKSNGNGGYTKVEQSDYSGIYFGSNNCLFTVGTSGIYKVGVPASKFNFCIPLASELSGLGEVFLCINSRVSSDDVSSTMAIYEQPINDTYSNNDVIKNWGAIYSTYNLGSSTSYDGVIVEVEKGKTYTYSGVTAGTTGLWVGLAKRVGGAGSSFVSNLKASDFASGASWLSNDSFFSHSSNIGKDKPPATGTFTIPASADLAEDSELCLIINTRYSSTNNAETITLTKDN